MGQTASQQTSEPGFTLLDAIVDLRDGHQLAYRICGADDT